MWSWGALQLMNWGSTPVRPVLCSQIYHRTQGRWLVFLLIHSLPFPVVILIDRLCFRWVHSLSEQSLHLSSLDGVNVT